MEGFGSWDEAERVSIGGHEASEIVARVEASNRFLESSLREKPEVPSIGLRVLAAMSQCSFYSAASARILDFGGSIGTHFRMLRGFLPVKNLEWNIVEVSKIVSAAKQMSLPKELRFFDAIDQVGDQQDCVLTSGALQYCAEPTSILKALIEKPGAKNLIIDRTPLHFGNDDRMAMQRAHFRDHVEEYPCWFFSEERFLGLLLESGFRIRLQWDVPEDNYWINQALCRYKGFLLERI